MNDLIRDRDIGFLVGGASRGLLTSMVLSFFDAGWKWWALGALWLTLDAAARALSEMKRFDDLVRYGKPT